jgi:sugar diacid utilization regulator
VETLTSLDIFRKNNIELVSGKSGLFRYVSWPHVLLAENTREWLIGGDVIIAEILAPLRSYDERHNLNPVHSLQVLCACGMNINQSAGKLLVHKNTLLKRIARIEEILEVSLKDVDTSHHLYNVFQGPTL